MTAPRYWKPLKMTTALRPPSEELVRAAMDHLGCDRTEALARLEQESAGCVWWVNNLYQVEVRDTGDGTCHLNIRRLDGAPVHDWRHLQQIKNEIVGPECEAIELYPAESRLVDTSNKYHLFASRDPEFRFPIGFKKRDVQDGTMKPKTAGIRQRPL